jgi:POTRA domain, FtsQ-type
VSRLKRRAIGVLFGILMLELLYFGIIAPRTILRKLVISANFDVLDSDIYNLAHLEPGMPIMQVDSKVVEQLLLEQSMIHEAKVVRGLWGRLYVELRGYNPAVALITTEGSVLFLDQEGYLFASQKKTGIFPPILSGASLESDANQHLRLHSSLQPLLYALTRLKELDLDVHRSIAGIQAVSKDDNLLYWELSFIHLKTKAIFASYLKAEDIKLAILVLSILEEQGEFLGSVDFRTPEIVFRRG